jgi:hypothetical protein
MTALPFSQQAIRAQSHQAAGVSEGMQFIGHCAKAGERHYAIQR